MTLTDAGKVRNTEIARELCLPPVKRMSSIPSYLLPPLFHPLLSIYVSFPNPCIFNAETCKS